MSEISIRSEAKKMVRQYNKTKSSNVRSLTKRTDCGYLNQKKYQAFKKALQALEFEHLCETFFPTQCNARLSPGIYPPIVSTMISLDGFSAANYLQIKPCWSVRLGLFVQDLKNKKIAQAFSLFTKNTKSKYVCSFQTELANGQFLETTNMPKPKSNTVPPSINQQFLSPDTDYQVLWKHHRMRVERVINTPTFPQPIEINTVGDFLKSQQHYDDELSFYLAAIAWAHKKRFSDALRQNWELPKLFYTEALFILNREKTQKTD